MCVVHHLANLFVVVSLKGLTYGKHTNYLSDDVACTLVLSTCDFVLHFVEHFHRSIAQALHLGMLLADNFCHMLALQTALVVGRTLQFVLHAAVHQDELVALGMPGEVFDFTTAAVHTHQVTGFAKAADCLVHDATVHTDVLVLCALTDTGQFHAINLATTEEVVDAKGIGALEGSRRTHACTEGHITSESGVEALHGNTQSHHLAANAVDVASPCGGGTFLVVERELYAVLQVDAVCINCACAVGLDFSNHSLLYSTWEYISIIIICMFADEVDATWRSIY